MTTVTLDFTKHDYSDASVYSEQELFQQVQMEQAFALLDKIYKSISNDEENRDVKNIKLYHNTISILADRGAGKTTFVLNLLKKIEKENKDVFCLKLIDPSLIETKQHPFISIISLIDAEVGKIINNYKTQNLYTPCGKNFEEYARYKDTYKKLLAGLPFIDGVGKQSMYEEWEDEEFISSQGMKKAKSSNELEQNFHDYAESALRILEKKCLVIPFDDVDTDFKKGFEILEIIRKYLTSNRIIPIITGDLELYSNLIRKAYWEIFDDSYLNKEQNYSGRDVQDFSSMINQLENQYLIKVLKPENRIILKSLKDLLDSKECSIRIINNHTKDNDNNEVFDLGVCYNKIYSDLTYGLNIYPLNKDFVQFLESLSVRVQISILTEWHRYEYNVNKKDENNNSALTLISKLFSNFWNDVNQKSNNAKELMYNDGDYGLEIFRFLLNSNSLFTSSNLSPNTPDKVLNKALLVLGLKFAPLAVENKSLVFEYFTRVLFIRNMLDRMGVDNDKDITEKFIAFSHMSINSKLDKSVCLSSAYYSRHQNKRGLEEIDVMPGTIYLSNYIPVGLTDANHVISLLPMFGIMNVYKRENVYFSIYKFFAVIFELLKEYETRNFNTIIPTLNKLSQYKYYTEPQDIVSSAFRITKESEKSVWTYHSEVSDANDFKFYGDFNDEFISWSDTKVCFTPQQLERVFNRLYDTILYIDKNRKYENLADKWQAYIIALLNAALVEDVLNSSYPDHVSSVNLNLNTIGDIEEIYLSNLDRFRRRRNRKYNMHRWLIKCPLILIYLDNFWYNIIKKSTDLDQSFLGTLRYNRLLSRQNVLKDLIEQNSQKMNESENLKKWLSFYHEYNEISRLRNIAYSNLLRNDIASDEQEKLQEQYEVFSKRLKVIENKYPSTYLNDKFEISINTPYNEVVKYDDENNIKITKLKIVNNEYYAELGKIESYIKEIADFIKEDYDKIISQETNSRPVYDILKNIDILG